MTPRERVLGTRAALLAASLAAHAAAAAVAAWWAWSPAPGGGSPPGLRVDIVRSAPQPHWDPVRAPTVASRGAAAPASTGRTARAPERKGAGPFRVARASPEGIPRPPAGDAALARPGAVDLPLAAPAARGTRVTFAGEKAGSAGAITRPPAFASEPSERDSDGVGDRGWSGKHLRPIKRRIQYWLDTEGYPRQARRMWLTGKSEVTFTIRPDGTPANVRVTRSTGHDVLDRRAVEAVLRAAPYPRPPEETEVTIPIHFRLVSF